MVSINYSLIGANGDEIVFDYSNYVLNPGFTGINSIPATSVRIDESAADGGVWRHSKRGVRNIDLPITIVGTDRADAESKLRRLARLTQDALGATVLSANYSDGTSITIGLHYVGGADSTQWGTDSGMIWCRWVMSFQAPIPFWQSTTVQTFSVGSGGTGNGLLPELTRLRLGSNQSLGVVNVNNTGDVAALPIWTVEGPVTDLIISNGTQAFGFNETVDAGEIITINTETGIVTDATGANRYPLLNPAPKLFALQPGQSSISVEGVDASSATKISCYYSLRYEVVH